jgi:hypothetical protein
MQESLSNSFRDLFLVLVDHFYSYSALVMREEEGREGVRTDVLRDVLSEVIPPPSS